MVVLMKEMFGDVRPNMTMCEYDFLVISQPGWSRYCSRISGCNYCDTGCDTILVLLLVINILP